MADLSVKLGKLRLASPIICASGTFGFGDELAGLADFKSIGAVVAKTITLKARQGNPPPRIYEACGGVINSVGLANPGVNAFIKDNLPQARKIPTKYIVSIGGFSFDDYKQVLKKLSLKKEIDAFEINLSCPNLKLKKLISQNALQTLKLVRILRKTTRKPLLIKITPEVTDIKEIARAVGEGGADALSLVNTYFSLAINIQTKKPYLGNTYGGYSGPAIKPMSLYRVWRAAQAIKIPVIGGGGIASANDAIEFFLAGASAISIGTVNMVHPKASKEILEGIKAYLKKKKIKNIKSLNSCLKTTKN